MDGFKICDMEVSINPILSATESSLLSLATRGKDVVLENGRSLELDDWNEFEIGISIDIGVGTNGKTQTSDEWPVIY